MAKGITKVWYGDYAKINTSPAFCNRQTGELYINVPVYSKFNQNERYYILLHELGHIVLNTNDELKADEYASTIYLKKGYSLTDSVKALGHALKYNKQEDYIRTLKQFERAKKYDFEINGHDNKIDMEIPNLNFSSMDGDSSQSIISKIVTGSNSLLNGINTLSGIKKDDSIFIPNQKTTTSESTEEKETTVKKNNNWLYIGIASVIVVILIIVIVIKTKKS